MNVMGKVLEITELGNPVLRDRAEEVEDLHDSEIQHLVDDMIATAFEAKGVGIAAPQVAERKRVFIMLSHPNDRYPDAPEMEPTAIINPEIIFRSDEIVKDWEGCLSIPGIRGTVPRHKSIRARYFLRDGKQEEREFSDFLARIFQHEYDHINGVLFIDRLESNKDIVTEKEYQKLVSAYEGNAG